MLTNEPQNKSKEEVLLVFITKGRSEDGARCPPPFFSFSRVWKFVFDVVHVDCVTTYNFYCAQHAMFTKFVFTICPGPMLSLTGVSWLCFYCKSFLNNNILRIKRIKNVKLISSIMNGHCFIHWRRKAQNKLNLSFNHLNYILGAILKKTAILQTILEEMCNILVTPPPSWKMAAILPKHSWINKAR